MSSWDEIECPYCGLKYKEVRTGLTYKDVHDLLWSNSAEPCDWKYKRRGTVLGLWHEIKLQLWGEHVHGCAVLAGDEPWPEGIGPQDDEVPF